jgi:uncharacterized OsmC-like protein
MDPSQTRIIVEGLRKRREGSDDKLLLGAERVDVKYLGDLKFKVRKSDFEFLVDEPIDRGGNDTAPNPLAYFLAGAASCLMMQYVRLAIAKNIAMDSFECTARVHFSRRVSGAFKEVIYDAKIQSKRDASTIIELSKEAEEMCIAHNTLLNGVKMTTHVYLNGKLIVTHESKA